MEFLSVLVSRCHCCTAEPWLEETHISKKLPYWFRSLKTEKRLVVQVLRERYVSSLVIITWLHDEPEPLLYVSEQIFQLLLENVQPASQLAKHHEMKNNAAFIQEKKLQKKFFSNWGSMKFKIIFGTLKTSFKSSSCWALKMGIPTTC